MSIGLPQDAEGREIPLDTKRLYDSCGLPVCIRAFRYDPHECFWRVERLDGLGTPKTTELRFTPPDSWGSAASTARGRECGQNWQT